RVGHVAEVRVRDLEHVVDGLEDEAVPLGECLIRRRVDVTGAECVLAVGVQARLRPRVLRARDRKAMRMRNERSPRRGSTLGARLTVRPVLAGDLPVMAEDRRMVFGKSLVITLGADEV